MSETSKSRSEWQDHGFSAPPDIEVSSGTEIIYRAVGGASVEPWSNCFFTPVVAGSPVNYWTAEMLERELNAALWGNDFERMFVYQMVAGTRYEIGPIAHDHYAGFDRDATSKVEKGFYQRSWVTPSGIFHQVRFLDVSRTKMTRLITSRGSFAISAGRYAREQAARARNLARRGIFQ
jgi:hypothetical protein